ncbi:hypothetical protein MOP88_13520 [Sphingomonas sp. WKB10]|nr:hypothetical protein [Sphingomonas sp. WKB10]
MHFRWTDGRIDEACSAIRAGSTYEQIGELMGTTKSAITGLVMRLRNAGDARLPQSLAGPAASLQGPRPDRCSCRTDGRGCASISAAAIEMGISQSRADQLWQRIRAELGEQAQ